MLSTHPEMTISHPALYNHDSTMQKFRLPNDRTKVVAIISKPEKPELPQILAQLLAWFDSRSYRVLMDNETATYITGPEAISRADIGARPLDLVVVLGGDGTLLAAARA